jgi:hypothetical protein
MTERESAHDEPREREIIISPKFKKVLRKKSSQMQAAILRTIARLELDVTHPGLRVHKMSGVGDVWEAYVDASNRVTFHWEGGAIVLRMNCNHDMLYKNP